MISIFGKSLEQTEIDNYTKLNDVEFKKAIKDKFAIKKEKLKSKVGENQLKKLARDSLIREKIKKNELLKFYDFSKTDKFANEVLKEFYTRLNFNNLNIAQIHLNY